MAESAKDISCLKEKICGSSEKYAQEIKTLCRYIFNHPETGLKEYQSSSAVIALLEKHGFVVEKGCAGMETSFRAVRALKKPGPRIAFLCEYDALPSIGHACGHNIIAAGSAGAAMIAADYMDEYGGEIIVLGTPAEEGGGGGKVRLLNAGYLDDCDCAMMLHPGFKNMSRDRFTAINRFKFIYHGKAAHAAGDPQSGINALEAVLQLFRGVDGLRLHLKKDISVHGIITKGGVAINMIPDLCEAQFAVRGLKRSELSTVINRLFDCAKAAALATGCTLETEEIGLGYDDFVVNTALSDLLAECMNAFQLKVRERTADDGMGSTDAGNVSHKLPTLHGVISFNNEYLGLHTIEFKERCGSNAGEELALTAAGVLGLEALCIMTDRSILKHAWAEHEEATGKGAPVQS